MKSKRLTRILVSGFGLIAMLAFGQQPAPTRAVEVRLHIVSSQPGKHHSVPAIAWLEPLAGTPALPFPSQGRYTLLQKSRTFIPHLQVIPVGSVVQFPNADPFFHNVFSLFEGKRFDLGLYEAGSSKAVTFSREGVSYIFCNIHPEMSAVIVTLSTPLHAIADTNDSIVLHKVPPGDYKIQIWVEGVPQSFLGRLSRRIHVGEGTLDLGEMRVPIDFTPTHENKFGKPYIRNTESPYE
jgi:hypothetical protein